jgi:hypothetical protein
MIKDYFKVRDHKDLIRLKDSKGIVNKNNESLNKYREEREQRFRLSKMVEEHEQLKSDVSDIKQMLSVILGKLDK